MLNLDGLSLTSEAPRARHLTEAELLVRGAFDLNTRRKPEAFAADAVILWILNRSLLIISELSLYDAKPIVGGFSAHTASVWHNLASATPAAAFLWAIRKEPRHWVISE